MKSHLKIALITGVLALSAAPAMALAAGRPSSAPPTNQGTEHTPSNQGTENVPSNSAPPSNQGTEHVPSSPGAGAGLPAKAKAYGVYCQTESKEHVGGTPGTPFSQCVTAMAKLANGAVDNQRTACKEESKRHVAGQRGTPFSQCVSGGAKLLRHEKEQTSGE